MKLYLLELSWLIVECIMRPWNDSVIGWDRRLALIVVMSVMSLALHGGSVSDSSVCAAAVGVSSMAVVPWTAQDSGLTALLEEEALRLAASLPGLQERQATQFAARSEPTRPVTTALSGGGALDGGFATEAHRPLTRQAMLGEVASAWQRPVIADRSQRVSDPFADELAKDRLQAIFLPKIELRELPLSQVVEVLAQVAAEHAADANGFNIVLIDPERRDPLVSITLRRISLKRVLDFIVESVGFEYEVQRDAVVIRRRQGLGYGLETSYYPVSRSTIIRLTGLQGGGETGHEGVVLDDPFHVAPVERATGRSDTEARLKGFLQRAGVAFDSIEGADLALADGQLIITQTPRNHDKVRRLLQRYREVKQVEIEARFLEVQERNLEELGFEWALAGRQGQFTNAPARNLANAFSVGQEESRIRIERPGSEFPIISQGAPVLPITVDLAEAATPLLSLTGVLSGLQVRTVMRALERQSGNDLLSAPKLTVLSGKTAEIVVAEEFRYPESYGDMNAEVGRGDSSSGSAGVAITAGTPLNFTTRNVGVEMEVTATVEEDNAISLRLRPKVTEFEGFVQYGGTSVAIASDTTVTVPSGFYQPVFSVRRLDTEVTIWDGATVVMGGLTREHAVRVRDKVPFLGDLPVLGRLFRSEGESSQKRNLLIFVTANLISPGGSPAFQYISDIEPGSLYQQQEFLVPEGLRQRRPLRR